MATPETFDRVTNVNLRDAFFLTPEIAKRISAELEGIRPVSRSVITISWARGHAGRAPIHLSTASQRPALR